MLGAGLKLSGLVANAFSAGALLAPLLLFSVKKQGREIEIIACPEEQKWCPPGPRPVDSVEELGVGVGWGWGRVGWGGVGVGLQHLVTERLRWLLRTRICLIIFLMGV